MSTADRADTEQFLSNIIQQAEQDAELVASFLEGNGIAPQPEAAVAATEEMPADAATEPRARTFLLELAAALRVASWRRAGLDPHLPADLPSTESALKRAAQAAATDNEAGESAKLAPQLFRTWLHHFVHGGQGSLQRDVVLDRQALDPDAMLERLADLLWRNRHLANKKEEH